MDTDDVVRELNEDDCWELLKQSSLGRLATAAGHEIDIFPVNYYADNRSILLRTAPGTKLLSLTVHDAVAFETDAYTGEDAWSVVVKGAARQLDSQTEIDAADRLPLRPWIPTLKYRYVRITPTSITGRAFRRLPEPERY